MTKMMKKQLLPILMIIALFVTGCVMIEPVDAVPGLPQQGAPASSGSVTSSDGVSIHYDDAGEGEPVLVFIQGWLGDRTYWDAQMAHFAQSQRVVAIDLGGHGESGLNREDWTIQAFGEDVRAVVEGLDLQNVVLVGHSLGGAVALEAASLMPDRVTAVIPVDSLTSVLPEEQRAEVFPPLIESLRTDFPAAVQEMAQGFFFRPDTDPEFVARIIEDMTSAPPSVGASAMEHNLEYDLDAALAKVNVPVHLLNADLAPTDLAHWQQVKPDVQLTILPGTGHFIMLEKPEEFNEMLSKIVTEIS